MIPLSYHEEYSKKSFFDLIQPLGEFNSENILALDKPVGDGTIAVIDIENGLQIRIWDCAFINDLEIDRRPTPCTGDCTFTIVYYLTPGSFKLAEGQNLPSVINRLWNTVLISSNAAFKVNILGKQPLKCLSINFTREWLQQNILEDIDFTGHLLFKSIEEKSPFVIFESLAQGEKEIIAGMFDNKFHQSFGKFFFRSKTLNLLTEFFLKLKNRASLYQGSTLYHEGQINQAEKKISEHLNSTLPNLRTLAKELSISESTLKRYFRKIYGKNISSYFFEKKMEYAKELLTKKTGTVTEVSYMLGYEKPSQFIRMFKRHYGVRPGLFKQTSPVSSL
jgi:AraC-like DNA-binding protein